MQQNSLLNHPMVMNSPRPVKAWPRMSMLRKLHSVMVLTAQPVLMQIFLGKFDSELLMDTPALFFHRSAPNIDGASFFIT